MSKKTVCVTSYVPKDVKAALKKFAHDKGISVGEAMRRALQREIDDDFPCAKKIMAEKIG